MNPEQDEMMQEEQGMMPEEQGMMPEEQGMSPEQQEQAAQIEQIAATAPKPEKPYTYKAIDKMADAMNSFVGKVDPAMQAAEYDPPEGEKKLDAPLPAEVYVPFAVIMGFIAQIGGYEKYLMNPEELVSDTALSKAAANFGRMAKDKKLMEALKAPPAEQEMDDEPEMSDAEMESGRMPDDVDDEDEEIMNMM